MIGMNILFYKLAARFGFKSVILEDHDTEPSISFTYKLGGKTYARRFGRLVRLNADGTCSGPVYVKSWVPLS